VIIDCSVFAGWQEWNSWPLSSSTGGLPAGSTWNWRTLRPDRNTVLPPAEMLVNMALPLPADQVGHAAAPAAVAPSAPPDCQTDCWSLCENNLGGSAT
jgi:hypothetical protein